MTGLLLTDLYYSREQAEGVAVALLESGAAAVVKGLDVLPDGVTPFSWYVETDATPRGIWNKMQRVPA